MILMPDDGDLMEEDTKAFFHIFKEIQVKKFLSFTLKCFKRGKHESFYFLIYLKFF